MLLYEASGQNTCQSPIHTTLCFSPLLRHNTGDQNTWQSPLPYPPCAQDQLSTYQQLRTRLGDSTAWGKLPASGFLFCGCKRYKRVPTTALCTTSSIPLFSWGGVFDIARLTPSEGKIRTLLSVRWPWCGSTLMPNQEVLEAVSAAHIINTLTDSEIKQLRKVDEVAKFRNYFLLRRKQNQNKN